MNDRDFDKLFGDRLREERRFNDDDNDWTYLAARLDAAGAGSATAVAATSNNTVQRWILPVVALLLLTTSGMLFAKLTRLDESNAALMEQIQTLKPQLTKVVDTVFITKTDTVFIERNAAEPSSQNLNFKTKKIGFNYQNRNANLQLNNELSSNANLQLNNELKNNTNLQLNNELKDNANAPLNTELKGNANLQLNNELKGNANAPLNNELKGNANAPLNNELKGNTNLQLNNELNNAANSILELKAIKLDLENKLQHSENQRFALEDKLKILEEKERINILNAPLNPIELTDKKALDNTNKSMQLATFDSISLYSLAKKIADSMAINSKIGPLSITTKNTLKINNRPTTARLFAGLNAGLIYYKSTWKSATNIAVSRNEKSYQVGLKLEYALTDRLRLTAGGDYCPFNFDITWQDSRYNLPTPTHFYPQTERIRSSKAKQELMEGFIGSKYLFTDGTNRWRPYVGAAYAVMRIRPFETQYTIQNLTTSAIRTQNETTKGTNIANLLLLNGGIEYRFNRRFVLQGETFYSLELNRPQKTYDLFGVRSAFLFNF